jgi:8-oxo-dGTP diphosphatase
MPGRSSSSAPRRTARRAPLSVDVILLTPQGRHLAVLLTHGAERTARARWELPWAAPRPQETIDDTAARLARAALGAPPALIEQVAAFGDRRRHPADATVSVAYFGLVAAGVNPTPAHAEWVPVDELPVLAPRQRAMLDGALQALRLRLDQAPIAFRLLPPTFTLSQLQEIYELLLGRRLHKASFRRALHAARLVEPTDEWRSEGRGRPAQLFRYAPKKRRGAPRGVRFEG